MTRRTLAACAALTMFSASQAFADDVVTARLVAPVPAKTKFIAGGAMFTCEGDTCIARAPTSVTFAVATCKIVADKVGPVAAFSGHGALDVRNLAGCNERPLAKAAGARTLAKQ